MPKPPGPTEDDATPANGPARDSGTNPLPSRLRAAPRGFLKPKFVAVMRGVGIWGFTTILANLFALIALGISWWRDDYSDRSFNVNMFSFRDFVLVSGNAATIAVGVTSAAIAELLIRGTVGRKQAFFAVFVVIALVLVSIIFKSLIAGPADNSDAARQSVINNGKSVVPIMIVVSLAIGAVAQLFGEVRNG
jgi:hypothetical protein